MSGPGFTLYCVDVIKTRHDSSHGYFILPVTAHQLEGNKILITDHKCVFQLASRKQSFIKLADIASSEIDCSTPRQRRTVSFGSPGKFFVSRQHLGIVPLVLIKNAASFPQSVLTGSVIFRIHTVCTFLPRYRVLGHNQWESELVTWHFVRT